MIEVRRADERGGADYGWLHTRHTFAFGEYRDPKNVRFRSLRVLNEDRVAPGAGFPKHGHADMEILSYVLEGALEHKDSMGNGSVIHAGELQRMTAGSGVEHSEKNASAIDPVHFYQIWLFPDQKGLEPDYEQRAFDDDEKRGRLRLVASPDGADGSLRVHQDARIYLTALAAGESVASSADPERHLFVQVVQGVVEVNGEVLAAGDGARLSGEAGLHLIGRENAAETDAPTEALVFDLA